jgi:hypothetical protein
MALAIKRRGLLRAGAETAAVAMLGLLAMANPFFTPKGSGITYSGGFSSGSWSGSPAFNAASYKFGIIDASTGVISELCSYSTATDDDFPGAAQAVYDGGAKVHAFWFLTSNYVATNTCSLNLTPYQWGNQQAQWFLTYIANSGYTGTVSQLFGDVERVSDAAACAGDLAGWLCDTPNNNGQVIKGFQDAITFVRGSGRNGIYSSVGEWPQVTNGANDSSVGTKNVWMASMCASQQQLDDQTQYFAGLGYRIFSWQYVINDNFIPGCATCQLKYAEAERQAKDSSFYVPRWDVWTNSRPDIVCQ